MLTSAPLVVLAMQIATGAGSDAVPAIIARAADAGGTVVAQEKKTKAKKQKKAKKTTEDEPPPDVPMQDQPDEPDEGGGARWTWKQHPSFRYGSILRVDFTAQLQEDVHGSYDGAELQAGLDTFDLHRNRIGVEGKLFKRFEYEVKRELTEKEIESPKNQKSQWKDVYVNYARSKRVQLQAGRFKVPFGLDELTSVTHNDFVYRSLGAVYLAPGRDTGVMFHGRLKTARFTYAAGGFAHDGDHSKSTKLVGADQTFATRATAMPFARSSSIFADLQFGGAFLVSSVANSSYEANGLRGRTVMTQDTFFHAVYVQGMRRRWEADVDLTHGPAGVRAEYTHVLDSREHQSYTDADLPDARYQSWYVSGTWVLTGEPKRRPVRASAPLLRGGIGAIEVAARVEHIWYDSVGPSTDFAFANPRAENILASGDRALTLGVNWTLNRFVKLQFNAIRESIDDPERSPVSNGEPFWSRVLRFQFVL